MDYGAPIGYRIASKHPERIQALIVQNGNAYDEGLRDFWIPIKAYWKEKTDAKAELLKQFITLDGLKWQYTHGTRNPEVISPDNWILDHAYISRPGNAEIQLALFYDYRSNPPMYP
jgi:pimeloyl-ACP methyl ester carboxylesterase